MDARIVEKAVDQRADEVVPPDIRLAVAERRALALVAICQGSLYDTEPRLEIGAGGGGGHRRRPHRCSQEWRSRSVGAGRATDRTRHPRRGFCNGIVEVVGIAENGEPLDLGRRSRTVPHKLRRFVLGRDGGCTMEGCASRSRLEVPHNPPWSSGGETNDDVLITLCWYHRHIAVHREGLDILGIGTSRVRLKRPR